MQAFQFPFWVGLETSLIEFPYTNRVSEELTLPPLQEKSFVVFRYIKMIRFLFSTNPQEHRAK